MTWEVFTGAGPDIAETPRLSIRTGGELYLNAAADRAWFTDAEAVTILLDRQSMRLAVAPEDRGGRTYSLSRESHAGAQFGAGAPVRDMGIDPAALDGAQQLDLEWDADLDAAVADLSVLLADSDDSTEPEAVEADPVETDAGDDTNTGDTPCEGSDGAVEAADEETARVVETDGEGAPERRFGADKHESADDPGGLSDELLRDLARAEETVIGFAAAHPDLTIATARAANTRLGLGLEDQRGYGSQWSDRGGESA